MTEANWVAFFFFNDTATTEIYTLSLHDALPISTKPNTSSHRETTGGITWTRRKERSEEHTSELQSHLNLVCRLLLEKKKTRQQCPRRSLIGTNSFVPGLKRLSPRTCTSRLICLA